MPLEFMAVFSASRKPARQEVEIYTDGACEPNPGPGGYGVGCFLCPKCQAIYTVEEAERTIERLPTLF